jgi:hypothetical protein
LNFKGISTAENSNKFQKNQVLKGKISWKRGGNNTWRLTIQFKHDFLSYLASQKIDYTHYKNNVHMLSFPIV